MKQVLFLFFTCAAFHLGLSQTVVDVIVDSDVHTTLETAVVEAGLAGTLADSTALYTVFAPTDSAFTLLPEGLLESLLADTTGALSDILLYHVVGDSVASSSLMDSMVVATLLGEDVLITIDTAGMVFVNNAQVISADIPASNGIVHVIDAVLIPPMDTVFTIDSSVVDIVVGSADHTILETAVIEAGLVETLSGEGPFTIFAPTDSAFAALPEGLLDTLLLDPTGELTNILLYHVLGAEVLSTDLSDGQMAMTLQGAEITVSIDSSGVMINNALVTVADLQADNGVVHVIDAVLVPPVDTMVVVDSSVVDIVVGSADHTILETAVIEAGLVETLSGEGPFTIFAPTDSAFAALPEGLLDTLLLDPTGELTNILLYHVLGAEVLSTELSDGQTAMTLQGTDITVTIDSSGVFINDAMVTVADLMADNGVVHVIDAVLVPTTTVGTPAELASTVGIEVFPNPTTDVLEVRFPQTLSQKKHIRLLTIQGRELRSWNTQAYAETLSLKDINRGTYFLLIESEAGKGYFQRIVVN